MMNRPKRTFYTFILLSFLSLFLPAFFALADEPAPATALPPFVKARLDHVGPNRIGDDHWLDPAHSTTKDATHTLTGSISGYVRLWDSTTAALAWESRPSKTAITDLTFIDKSSAGAPSVLAKAPLCGVELGPCRRFSGTGGEHAFLGHGLILEELFHAGTFTCAQIKRHPGLAGIGLERCQISVAAQAR